jgi:hypothetical protein
MLPRSRVHAKPLLIARAIAHDTLAFARYMARAYSSWLRLFFYGLAIRATDRQQRLLQAALRADAETVRVVCVLALGFVGAAVGMWMIGDRFRGELIWPPLVVGLLATGTGVYLAIFVERELERRREMSARRTTARSALLSSRLSYARSLLVHSGCAARTGPIPICWATCPLGRGIQSGPPLLRRSTSRRFSRSSHVFMPGSPS